MRKLRKANNRRFGICVLVFSLIVTGGIARIKNAKAEENIYNVVQKPIPTMNILSTDSIYIKGTRTVNVVSRGSVEIDKPKRPNYNISVPIEYQDLIFNLCQKNNLNYEFVLSVFHYESKFNFNAINKNSNGSYDLGFCQLNSYFLGEYRDNAVKYCNLSPNVKFNVFNPDHNIRAGIGTIAYLKNYWVQRGVSDQDLLEFITGSFNLGCSGFEQYIKKTGKIEREYSRQIEKRKYLLKTSNTF